MSVASVIACGVLGLLVGSFLNVVIWRVPRGESIVRPASRCPSCGRRLRVRDNVPVVSWLLLRGRCRDCHTKISFRYPVVELLTGVVFAVLAWRIGAHFSLIGYLFLGAVGVALAAIDIDVRRLPHVLTMPGYAVGPVVLAVQSGLDGRWWPLERALIGMVALYAFYFVLWFFGGMGFGDVNLAGVLGLFLAWLGWGALVVGTVAGFAVGAFGGLALIMAGKSGLKSKIPYGPYMLAGALVGILAGQAIAHAYWHATVG